MSPILEPVNIKKKKEKTLSQFLGLDKEEENLLKRHFSASLPGVAEEENIEDKTFDKL